MYWHLVKLWRHPGSGPAACWCILFSKDVNIKEGGLISDPLCCGFHDLKTKSSSNLVILILAPRVILFIVISLWLHFHPSKRFYLNFSFIFFSHLLECHFQQEKVQWFLHSWGCPFILMFSVTVDSLAFLPDLKGDFSIQKWKPKLYDVNQQFIWRNTKILLLLFVTNILLFRIHTVFLIGQPY